MVHTCYSSTMFLVAYGPKIIPYSDKDSWEKVSGPQVLPPKYEKRVGRPTKNRRKIPIEIETASGTKLSKHGVSMTCSYCGIPGHNKSGCKLRKDGQMPPQQADGTEPVPINAVVDETGEPDITAPINIASPIMHHEDMFDYSMAKVFSENSNCPISFCCTIDI